MKKNQKQTKTIKKKTISKTKSDKERNNIQKNTSSTDKFEAYFSRTSGIFFYVSLVFTIVFGILLFSAKVSTGGDDSEYIIRAINFMKGKNFPTFQGSFYPMFLSFWIAIFNMDLVQLIIVLKIISLILIIGHLVFMYLAFKDNISASVLSFVMIFVSINAYILYFGSQTYSEALFLFLQSLAFYLLTRSLDIFNLDSERNLKTGSWLLFGLVMFLLVQTRNIGYAMLFTMIVYLLVNKKYRLTLYSIGSYLVYAILFTLYKLAFWNIKPSDTGGRLELILLKDTYNPGAGTEDFKGMLVRFIENSKIFLSKQMGVILGFAEENQAKNSGFFTVVIILLLVGFLIYSWKKSKSIKFIGLYLLFSLGITFISLQQRWGQLRLILVYVPLILLFLGSGISLLASKKYQILHYLILLFFVISCFKSIGVTIEKTKENSKILSKNLQGDMYYGLTPDWINYLKMCAWTGKNLPEETVVACRKPSIAYVYSNGRDFHRINKVPSVSSLETVEKIMKKGGNYYILKLQDLGGKKIDNNVMLFVRRNIEALVVVDQTMYGIFDFAGNEEAVSKAFTDAGLTYDKDLKRFVSAKVKLSKRTSAYVPEDLLMALYDKRVEFIIQASLRRNPLQYTGHIINTVSNYRQYVEYKYPGIFSVYSRTGGEKPENEPCTLYKINYRLYQIGE